MCGIKTKTKNIQGTIYSSFLTGCCLFSIWRSFKLFLKLEFLKTHIFKFLKITKTVHYLGLTYGKFHSGISMESYFSSLFCFTMSSFYFFKPFLRSGIFERGNCLSEGMWQCIMSNSEGAHISRQGGKARCKVIL
jgi:hypothetical protein